MTLLTLSVVLIGGIGILGTRPVVGLVVYIATMCFYPQYLVVSIGSVDLSTGRILALLLFVRIVTRPLDASLMRVRWIDILVFFSFGCAVLATLTNEAASKVIEREGGRFLDTMLAYIVARLTLRTRADAYTLINGVIIIGLPLALIGIYQSLTGHNPYAWMLEYSPFMFQPQEMNRRMGLYRADASFGNKISFGLFFAILIPLHISMFFVGRRNMMKWSFRMGLLLIGLVSAMSSAPLLAFFISTAIIISYPKRGIWPYLFVGFVALCVVIELGSNRHFYHVLTRFALDASTAYYRIELVEEALGGGMRGHWLTGYGYVGVGIDWERNGFRWRHYDLANLYIYQLATTGLVGMGSYILLNIGYYWCLIKASAAAKKFRDKWIIWCISAGLIGWNFAMLTVGTLAQTNNLMYILIALAGASPYVFREEPEGEPAPAEAPIAPRPRAAIRPQMMQR